MRPKEVLSFATAVLFGVVLGGAIKISYALPGLLPTSDLFVEIVTSRPGLIAIEATSGKAGPMIAILIRAFPWSILAGILAGIALPRIRYKRAFCYSALWLPLANVLFGYLSIQEISATHPEYMPVVQAKFGEIAWINLSVYGWYFLALYSAYAVSIHFRRASKSPITAVISPSS